MDPRTTTSSGRAAVRRGRVQRSHRRPPAPVRRPGLYLGVAAAGALLVNVLVGTEPAAQAEVGATESVSVAQQLGLTAQSAPAPVDVAEDLQPLEELTASRSAREAEQVAAQQAQEAADQAELDRQAAEAKAAEEAAAQAAEAAEAAEQSAAAPAAERPAAQESVGGSAAAAGTAVSATARISNSSGSVRPQAQAAADAVVSNVPGAAGITIGGTRASAADPGGHPSGLALDYMVGAALGDAIVAYHVAHWDELGVDYLIWEQRMLSSPGGSWKSMADRGSATANHYDHVHVNYRG